MKVRLFWVLFKYFDLYGSLTIPLQMTLCPTDFHPGFSVDCVVFGFHDRSLKVLLLKMKRLEKWALPGGFVLCEEDVDASASRVLAERTGLTDIFLRQFRLFGQVDRQDQGHADHLLSLGIVDDTWHQWFRQRFVSLGFYALVEYSQVQAPQPDAFSEVCTWCPLGELPSLMLDHAAIIAEAHQTLRRHLSYQPIGLNLLPRRFTMPELQALYETLLDKPLDRRNFQRRMLSYGILRRTEERRTGGAHKAPYLYEFDEKKYREALAEGLKGGW